MTQQTNGHWTDDEELLSKFVLHQLSDAEERRLSEHLRDCSRCQLAVDDETQLVAGVRHAGRLALKRNLESQLARSRQHTTTSTPRRISIAGIPWPRVASLAAALVIIIAVGVYNNWFGSRYRNVTTIQDTDEAQRTLSNEQKQESSPGMSEKKDKARIDQGTEKSAPDKKAITSVKPLNESPEPHAASATRELTKSITTPTKKNQRDELGATERQIAEYNVNLGDQASGGGKQSFWVEGQIISSTKEEPEVSRNAPSAAQQNQLKAFAAPEAEGKKSPAQLLDSRQHDVRAEFSLNQKPISSLPRTLQYRQKQNAGTVQTLIVSGADTVQLTLYLESPLPDSELQTADLQAVGNDSLILTLSNRQIGYKLPPPLQGQVNTKAKLVR